MLLLTRLIQRIHLTRIQTYSNNIFKLFLVQLPPNFIFSSFSHCDFSWHFQLSTFVPTQNLDKKPDQIWRSRCLSILVAIQVNHDLIKGHLTFFAVHDMFLVKQKTTRLTDIFWWTKTWRLNCSYMLKPPGNSFWFARAADAWGFWPLRAVWR